MYLLRAANVRDLPAIMELARHLDSPNLPLDEEFVRQRLERSERSFAERGPAGVEHEYQLALEDASGHVVGTSAVISKHGTPGMPHLYLRASIEERRAESVDVEVRHCTLQLGATEDGPTELGSLVLLPETRGQPGSPGKLLSWGRFTLIARHPACFENTVLAEMRATLDAEGRNAFWDAFGKRFTGMSYADADRRSAGDKAFIVDLFPDTPFYTALLPERVARELGQVHPEAQPAMRLLEKAGLHWIGEIDPFDAGPFVGAAVSEVIPIRDSRSGALSADDYDGADDGTATWIASTEEDGRFRAVASAGEIAGDGAVRLPKESSKRLGIGEGDEVALTPLPASSRGAHSG